MNGEIRMAVQSTWSGKWHFVYRRRWVVADVWQTLCRHGGQYKIDWDVEPIPQDDVEWCGHCRKTKLWEEVIPEPIRLIQERRDLNRRLKTVRSRLSGLN